MSKQKELFANEEIAEAEKTKLQPPPMYKVVLNNDDYTPMEFVVEVLQKFFGMDLDKATQVMLSVHYSGKGVCGMFTAEIAETKVVLLDIHLHLTSELGRPVRDHFDLLDLLHLCPTIHYECVIDRDAVDVLDAKSLKLSKLLFEAWKLIR